MAPRIDAQLLRRRLTELGAIGADPKGGLTRLVYSDEERAAAQLVADWMAAAGLVVRRDAVGNLFGRWPDVSGPAVWTGSHLDTVSNGGAFDGAAGVLSALAAVEALQSASELPPTPIEVCVFVGEEGSRFPGGLLGSRAVVEGLSSEELQTADHEGVTLAEAMQASGLDPGRFADARIEGGDVVAYLELHIEQGPVLEGAGLPVGIVTAIAGPLFLEAKITGRADHAGTTPMGARADSLLGAAETALEVERIAASSPTTVGTVGRVECYPGAHNVIPSRTELTVDLRDVDLEARDAAQRRLGVAFEEVLERRGLVGVIREVLRVEPQPVPPALVSLLEAAAAAVGVPTMRLASGAAHDAMVMGRITDSGMIFVASRGGRSHTPEEHTDLTDLAAGATVLADALTRFPTS